MAKGNERDDSRGGIGQGGPQRGDTGHGTNPGGGDTQDKGDTSIEGTGGMGGGDLGQGSQRTPGGSSRDSENLG